MEDILIPLGFFTMIVLIVFFAMVGGVMRRREIGETVRELSRSGQTVDPALIREMSKPKKSGGDLKGGLILIAIAAALVILGFVIARVEPDDAEVRIIMLGVAAFPGLIGLVLVVFGLFNRDRDPDR